MDALPIFVKLAERPCLVVDGGEAAARKVAMVQEACDARRSLSTALRT
jgi:siroheme synthase (precorrin-2 oxidase/ferrochelatase)